MSGLPMISVIVPVYNAELYLCECLDSIIKQTYSNLEIIIIDDGSSDSSGAICDQYSKNDNRIKVIHKDNGGVSSARNAALDLACGDYVHFCDADDWLELNTYEVVMNHMLHQGMDIYAFNAFVHHDAAEPSLRIRNLPAGRYNKIALLKYAVGVISRKNQLATCFLCVTNKLIKATVLKDMDGKKLRFDEKMAYLEDGAFLIDIFSNCKQGYVDIRGFYHIRYHEESAMGRLESEKKTKLMLNGYEQLTLKKSIQENNIARNHMYNAYTRAALHYLTLCAQDEKLQMVSDIINRFADDASFQERAYERLQKLND